MKKLLLILLLLPATLTAQLNMDSLWAVWNDSTEVDTNRLNAIFDIAWDGFLFSNPDTAFLLAQQHYDFAKEKGLKKHLTHALNVQGASFYVMGKFDSAIVYWNKCYEVNKEISDKKGMASTLGNIGLVYSDQGLSRKALEYYREALGIFSEMKHTKGKASSLANIGLLYAEQKNHKKSLEYYQRALKIYENLGDKKGKASVLQYIGYIYSKQGDSKKALEYFQKALKISEEFGDMRLISWNLSSTADIFLKENDYKKALDYYNQAKNISEKAGFKQELSNALSGLGEVYKLKGDYYKALQNSRKALEIAQEGEFMSTIVDASKSLWEIHKALGQKGKALDMYEIYIKSRDSLNNKEFQKELLQQEFRAHAIADSITNAKHREVQQAKIKQQQAEIGKKQLQQYLLFGGIGVVVLFSGFMYNRFRVTQKQKIIIEEQKASVDEANEELNQTNEELASQRDAIEEQRAELAKKNEHITASINYAKRIQVALLKNEEHTSPHIPQHFILFKPKDIVSGDFYWALEKKGHLYLAAADCTGHGVPGAFLTMLGTSFLNEINSAPNLLEPAEILNALRDRIVKELSQTGADGDTKDGMDISLLRLKLDTLEASWAGANNPLYLLHQGSDQISVIKGDRMPIGYSKDPTPFNNHQLALSKGDMLYLFSDGYADQFGGPKGKKFGYKRFRELLLKQSNKHMEEQKSILMERFDNWISQSNDNQIDDVCVIGIRV